MSTTYRARYIVTPARVLTDATMTVEAGRITAIGAADGASEAAMVDLGHVAVVPGLVNAHSHAFQRALRGRTEHARADGPARDDFWTWRTAMYRVANALDPEQLEAVSAMAFLEMARAGITTIGEFHYLHHQPDGVPYADPNTLADRVIGAARALGLRICLLRVAYARSGPGQEPRPDQRRFIEPDPYTYLGRTEALAGAWRKDPLVTIGMAPHSVRAVTKPWLWAISDHHTVLRRPVHIHACEQPAELEMCRAEHGKEPVAVIADAGLLGPRTTLVHATHLDEVALELLAERRPTVCGCPLTEANLGDGMLPAEALLERGVRIALGTDGQSRIDPWAEVSRVEEQLRLRAGRRNVLARFAPAEGDPPTRREVGRVLFPMLAEHGAHSLGLDCGALIAGRPADFAIIDLHEPALAGTRAETLLADLTLAMTPRAVKASYVAGEPVVVDGRHPMQAQIIARFERVMDQLDRG